MTHARNRDFYIRVSQEQAPSTHDRASEQTLIYKGSQPTLGCAPQTNKQAYGHEGLLTWWQAAASNNATNRRATQATVSRTFFHIETSSASKLDLLPATHVRSPRLSKCLTATAATTLKSLLLLPSIPKRALVNGNFSNKCGTTSLS